MGKIMINGKILPVTINNLQGGLMHPPEMVDQILNLNANGWGKKRIARELGISRTTVKRYLLQKEWIPYKNPNRRKKLEGLTDWLEETFKLHKGNAAVVHIKN